MKLLYWIYKILPDKIRFFISFALSAKFVVGVIAFIVKDDSLLLFHNSYQTRWALPAGWLKRDEHIYRGIEREIKEEVGLAIEVVRIIETKNVIRRPVIDILVECAPKDGEIKPDGIEVLEAKFFPFDKLPSKIMATHKPYIDAYIKSRQNSDQNLLEVTRPV